MSRPTKPDLGPRTDALIDVIVERFVAGDTVAYLSWDYKLPVVQIESALRWRLLSQQHVRDALSKLLDHPALDSVERESDVDIADALAALGYT